MSETVIREVTRNVWTFSRPYARFGIIPIGGRSTAIRMKDGGVWLLASTPLDEETKSTLDNIGPVRFIIGAGALRHLLLNQYKKAYSSAKVIGPEAALARLEGKSLKFDGAWGRDPPDTKYGFEGDIKACYFCGFKNKDIAFFHPESKTLIEADLLMNLPCNEQYSKVKSGRRGPPHVLHVISCHDALSLTQWDPHESRAMKRDTKTVSSWDFERMIPCHGDVIEQRGKEASLDVYNFFLQND